GRFLDKEVERVEDHLRSKLDGKIATGQCDGWKNIAKASIVASMVTVDYEPFLIRTHDISADRKTGDNLLKLVLDDILYVNSKYGVVIIAWVTDDGGDGRKMRRLLLGTRPDLVVILCWAHQINLMVGGYLKLKTPFMECIPQALEVIKWFNNHSVPLGLLRTRQIMSFQGTFYALILPNLTRWTCHYFSLRRLLEVSRPMRSCCIEDEEKLIEGSGRGAEQKKAMDIIQTVGSEEFWRNIAAVKTHLQPFCVAAKILQRNGTTCDSVTLTLGQLYHIFDNTAGIDQQVRDDVFICAVILNPYLRDKYFNRDDPSLTPAGLFAMAKHLCQRVFSQDAGVDFYGAFFDYLNEEREFSRERMSLDDLKVLYDRENRDVNLVRLWSTLDNGKMGGRNLLVKFAKHILSIIPNSAGCERTFSQMGITHSKLRNRMALDTCHKTITVKMDLRRSQKEDGPSQTRSRKRKHPETETGEDSEAEESPYDYRSTTDPSHGA
ncbi:ribonuclease H-like domain-containing protein, partial [Lactarius hatsudake]